MKERKFLAFYTFLLLLLTLCNSNISIASPQKAILSIDSTSIRIGEQVLLKLQATLPVNAVIMWPAIGDTLTSVIEVTKKSKVDSTSTNRKDFINYSQVLTITSFDSGYHLIPPFTISYVFKGDTSIKKLQSDGIFLRVNTIQVDTTKAIRDIKAPLKAPFTFQELAPYIGMVALVALIGGLVFYYFWRRKLNKPIFPILIKQQGPPWEEALNNLNELADKRLWQIGKIKQYHTELTDILRNFLLKQHGIEAIEMTTSEILDAYTDKNLDTDSKSKLAEVLIRADLVKFAKSNPQASENENSLSLSREIILKNKPLLVEKENTQKEETPEIQ